MVHERQARRADRVSMRPRDQRWQVNAEPTVGGSQPRISEWRAGRHRRILCRGADIGEQQNQKRDERDLGEETVARSTRDDEKYSPQSTHRRRAEPATLRPRPTDRETEPPERNGVDDEEHRVGRDEAPRKAIQTGLRPIDADRPPMGPRRLGRSNRLRRCRPDRRPKQSLRPQKRNYLERVGGKVCPGRAFRRPSRDLVGAWNRKGARLALAVRQLPGVSPFAGFIAPTA